MKCGAEGVGDLHFFQTAFFFYFADGSLFDGFAGFQVAFGQIVHSQTFDSQQAVALPDYAAGSLIITEAGGHVPTLGGTPLPITERCSVWASNDVNKDVLKELAV